MPPRCKIRHSRNHKGAGAQGKIHRLSLRGRRPPPLCGGRCVCRPCSTASRFSWRSRAAFLDAVAKAARRCSLIARKIPASWRGSAVARAAAMRSAKSTMMPAFSADSATRPAAEIARNVEPSAGAASGPSPGSRISSKMVSATGRNIARRAVAAARRTCGKTWPEVTKRAFL
jgi:hypothetical protein